MQQRTSSDQLLIGAHTSAAGGAHNALIEGKSIGATTIQLFTSNQKQWKGKKLTDEAIQLFKETLEETKIQKVMSHASYLINLGSPNPELLEKSRIAFSEEIGRSLAYGLSFINVHPGARGLDSVELCLDRIAESLILCEHFFETGNSRILLETTAGQGTSVGHTFEQLAYILEKTKNRVPVGICIDTCHIFVAGYDIRNKEGWEKTLKNFDKVIGLSHLSALHLNDSVKPLGSKVDRHASLGQGEIGLESFNFLMTSPITREIPKYLETPEGPPVWDKEIWMLRGFADEKN